MSNYSHRGYEHRTSGYGRRRHKASGFKKKPTGGEIVKGFVFFAVAVVVIALVLIFVKYLKPFIDSFKDTETSGEISETIDTATPDSPDEPNGSFDRVDSKIFVSGGSGYVMFKGIDDTAANYSAVLNSIVSSMSSDVSVYNMVIPTSTEFAADPGLTEYSNSQKDNLDRMNSALMDRVINVDLYNTFDLHKNEYIYYRTDESITALGGYYAYREFAQTAQFSPNYIYSIDKLSEKKGNIRRFEGSFLQRTKDEKIQPHGNQELFDNANPEERYLYRVWREVKSDNNGNYAPRRANSDGSNLVLLNTSPEFSGGSFTPDEWRYWDTDYAGLQTFTGDDITISDTFLNEVPAYLHNFVLDVDYHAVLYVHDTVEDLYYPVASTIVPITWDLSSESVITSLKSIDADNRTVSEVEYYNVAGQRVASPNGMTIVVTHFTDGSVVSTKQIFK